MSRRTEFLNRALNVFLTTVERGENALPHPGTLFAILAGVVVVVSAIAARTGLEVIHPGTGELIQPVSLATVEGLHRILTQMVTNFTSFAPLGTVLVAMLGIGVMESSGLIGAAAAGALGAQAAAYVRHRLRRRAVEHRQRDRLRATGTAGGHHLSGRRPAPDRRARGRLCGRVRRL